MSISNIIGLLFQSENLWNAVIADISATIVLTEQNEPVLFFHDEGFQLPTSSQWR